MIKEHKPVANILRGDSDNILIKMPAPPGVPKPPNSSRTHPPPPRPGTSGSSGSGRVGQESGIIPETTTAETDLLVKRLKSECERVLH